MFPIVSIKYQLLRLFMYWFWIIRPHWWWILFKKNHAAIFWIDSILIQPESFPITPRLNFRIVANWPTRGFGIGFALPRVSLHHSCAACVIVAAPGVIISVIPAGIFAVSVHAMLVQVPAWACRRHPDTLGRQY